jgi:hypothetical protein
MYSKATHTNGVVAKHMKGVGHNRLTNIENTAIYSARMADKRSRAGRHKYMGRCPYVFMVFASQ